MYVLTSAVGVKLGLVKKWDTIALTGVSVASLFEGYRRVWLTLHLVDSVIPIYLDLATLRTAYATYAGDLSALVASVTTASLPTVAALPFVLKQRSARFCDAFKAGYTLTPVNASNVDTSAMPEDAKTHLRFTRVSPATDYTHFHQHCLVSINGFYHLSDTDGVRGVVVSDAARSLRWSRQNQIGLLSFAEVGAITLHPITPAMVHHGEPGQVSVTLPASMEGKTALLVLGGYLHAVDPQTFTRTGESSYRINFTNLPLLERYYESRRYMDLSALPLQHGVHNDLQVSLEELRSPAVLAAYLALSQSFFVLLDSEEVYVQTHPVRRTGLPDMYLCYSAPSLPLVLELGRQPEYWSTFEDGQYSLTIYDNRIANRLFSAACVPTQVSADDACVPTQRAHLSSAHFLEITRDV